MTREIKFRAWYDGHMVSPDHIDREGYGWWTENSIPVRSNNIMQFTGLQDKNGGDIYEGDIIALDPDYARSICADQNPCLVGFNDSCWCYGRRKYDARLMNSYLWMSVERCKVIGNIHENPELLETNND